jgi:AcrR family transcriptional regulator
MIYDSPVDTKPRPAAVRAGRPRSERARLAVLEACADLLIEGGLGAASIEAIAARAGVSKVTIYKWWPSRGSVAVDAFFHRYRQTIDFPDTGDLAADLTGQIRLLITAFRGRAGSIMAELIGQAQSDPALADTLRSRWLQPRRDASTAVLLRAVERSEIRADTDIAVVLDQLYAPLYYRLTMQHEPLTADLADKLVHTLLDGLRPRASRGAGSGRARSAGGNVSRRSG